jgi:Tol biopolymer transport system component
MTGSTIGHYRISDKLGAGGMGEVWRARDTRLNRDVAIKVLPPGLAADPERMARFEREAQVLASLNHPNIAVLHGLEIAGDSRALVMELVEGETLAERIARGAIPLDESIPIAKQIAEALEAAHEHGIIHRDLKPANVKITPQGVVKLLDFGLAKALDDAPGNASQANSPTLSVAATRAGVLLGTAGYMSPEQVKGKTADRRADIWAFGVVLYEMLTGRQLYRGETIADSLAAVITTTPDTSVLPPRMRALVERCLEKDPRLRLRDIGEARIALERPAGGDGPAVPQPRAPSRRPTAWIALAAVLLVALAALSWIHFRERPAPERQIEFALSLPGNERVHSFAVSPDGQWLAIAYGAPKTPILLRALSASEPAPLAGTEEGTYPFWSPDSKHLAFFSQGKLRRIAISGGPVMSLCDAPNGRGGDWNENGEIVFAPGNVGTIHRVRSEGGVSTAVTATKGTNRFPVFVPGSSRFLYLESRATDGGVHLATLGQPSSRQVLAEQSSVAFAPPEAGARHAHLLFVRENNLMALPVDPGTLEKAGEMFPVAERVGFTNVLNFAPVSVSRNGVLMYLRGGALSAADLTGFDRGGRQLGTVNAPPGGLARAALAPDGKRIAVEVLSSSDRANIWVLDPERGVNSQVSFRDGRNQYPVWSPDGKRLVMSGTAVGNNPEGLFVKDVSGAAPEARIYESNAIVMPTDWSSQGLLVFSEISTTTNTDLKTLRMDGKSKPVDFLATRFREFNGSFSPDGRWMAYQSDETGTLEVYVRPVAPDGSAGPGKWKISSTGGVGPRWTRNGNEIVYMAGTKVMAVPIRHLGAAIEPGIPQVLFDTPGGLGLAGSRRFDVSADGQRFLIPVSREQGALPLTVVVNWRPPSSRK